MKYVVRFLQQIVVTFYNICFSGVQYHIQDPNRVFHLSINSSGICDKELYKLTYNKKVKLSLG